MVATQTRLNPFPGLRPFETEENDLFFGREGQTDELLRRLGRTRFLAVVGTSGSGKSSLVRAGLLPSLYSGYMTKAGSTWRVALFRPDTDPIANLARALNKPKVLGSQTEDAAIRRIITETTLRRSALGLVEVVQQAKMLTGENLLILVDQFEELFRFKQSNSRESAGDEAAAFVKLLLEATSQEQLPIYVVLIIRSEYLGDCAQFRDLPEAYNDSQYLIPRMTREQRRAAIEGPVAVGGAKITLRLVDRLLNDVGDNPDQLPILQHALMRTWDYWMDNHSQEEPIDLDHYEAIGGMAEALSKHADEIYNNLPDTRSKEIAEKLFKCLTEYNHGIEIRRHISLKEVCTIAAAAPAEVIAVVEPFRVPSCSFLMPPKDVKLDANSVLDLSHESLMRVWKRLKDWVDEEVQSARIYRRLAETAALHQEGKARLLDDPELTIALTWREHHKPNQAWAERYDPTFERAMQFLEESKAARNAEVAQKERLQQEEIERQKRVRRNLTLALIAAVACLIVAICLGLVAFWEYREAAKDNIKALSATLKVFSVSNQEFEALKKGLKAGIQLKGAG